MKVTKQNGRNQVSRLFRSRNDKDKIAAWKLELNRILRVFNVCSAALVFFSVNRCILDRVSREHPRSGCRDS